jgi:hypothetical protein
LGTEMEFRVVAASYRRREQVGRAQLPHWWPDGTAHLMVNGAPDTLCAEPVDRFLPLDGVPADAGDVKWCWLCHLTAST